MRDRFRVMEKKDEKQIQREIKGEILDELVYTVDGCSHLSYAGVRYAAGLYGGLRVSKVECLYNEVFDQFEATVYAENTRNDVTFPGTAEHSATQVIEGKQVSDVFARRTAVSKATRNALIAVMPVEHVKAVITQLQTSFNSQDSVVEVPVGVDVESIKTYLAKFGVPVEALKYSMNPTGNVLKIRPTRFLGSIKWCAIDNALEKLNGTWLKEDNRWEVPC